MYIQSIDGNKKPIWINATLVRVVRYYTEERCKVEFERDYELALEESSDTVSGKLIAATRAGG